MAAFSYLEQNPMATNDFLPFAGGAGANALDQADYEVLTALSAGFTSGVAPSAACNKVWRQATIMAAVLAQLIVDNTGQNAVDDGTTATLLANLKAATAGRLINIQTFTANGTYTPTAGTKKVKVRVLGGGGAGGGTPATGASTVSVGGPGNGGTYAESLISSSFGGVTVTVGSAGIGAPNSVGGNGGTSSFGALVTCVGGNGGLIGATPAAQAFAGPPARTSASGGNIVNTPSPIGSCGVIFSSPAGGFSSCGANTAFGSGGVTSDGIGYGAGGGGAFASVSSAAKAGFNGAPGIVIIEEYA